MKNQLEPQASDLLGVPTIQKSRRDELEKGVRLHAENWYWDEYPRFKKGDLVWACGDPNTCMTVIEHQEHGIVLTNKGAFTTIQIQYFVLPPDEQEKTHEQKLSELAHKVNHARKVDFEMLKATIKAQAVLKENPLLKPGVENLELFIEMLGKSSSFAHLAHVRLRNQ